jgi:hypothetical protein
VRSRIEHRDSFGPEGSSLRVRAVVAADVDGSRAAEAAFVGHHGVMPRGQSSAERCRIGRSEARAEPQVWIHVTPLSRRARATRSMAIKQAPSPEILFALRSFVDGGERGFTHESIFCTTWVIGPRTRGVFPASIASLTCGRRNPISCPAASSGSGAGGTVGVAGGRHRHVPIQSPEAAVDAIRARNTPVQSAGVEREDEGG